MRAWFELRKDIALKGDTKLTMPGSLKKHNERVRDDSLRLSQDLSLRVSILPASDAINYCRKVNCRRLVEKKFWRVLGYKVKTPAASRDCFLLPRTPRGMRSEMKWEFDRLIWLWIMFQSPQTVQMRGHTAAVVRCGNFDLFGRRQGLKRSCHYKRSKRIRRQSTKSQFYINCNMGLVGLVFPRRRALVSRSGMHASSSLAKFRKLCSLMDENSSRII